MADISTWSPVDESNNQPPPDGFPEGMAPSGLNNGMRAVMGAVRRFYDSINTDISNLVAALGNYLPLTGGILTGTLNGTTVVAGQLTSTGGIDATGDIATNTYISAGSNITAGNNISAGGNIVATGNITGNDVHANGTLSSDYITGASVVGNNVHAYNTLSGVTLAVSGAATAASLSVSGNLNGYSLTVASNLSSGFLRSNAAHQAGTLMTHGGTNHVNFRWGSGSLWFRIDETVEHAIATTSLFAELTDTVNALQARIEAMEEASHAR